MGKAHILLAGADARAIDGYRKALAARLDAEIAVAGSGPAAVEQFGAAPCDLFLADLVGAAADIGQAARKLREVDPHLPVIVIVAAESPEAHQPLVADQVTIARPVDPALLVLAAERLVGERRMHAENELLRRQIERPYGFDDMIGGCPSMRKVFETIEQVAESDVDVLVVGETGTGKELVARSIHRRSRRASGPFVPVDCGAIPESLLESEFFGHERGAFTGADARRIGLVEFADRGSFFLDELGELPLVLQAKLLRMLQERKVRRVGGREEIDVDVRIVAATARNLDELIRQSAFRQDLYYRIAVVRIDLPPLRERGDDIGLLAEYMARRYAREMGQSIKAITPEAYQVLAQYRWPGNVRELQNVIRRALALSKGPMLGLGDLPDEVVAAAGEGRGSEHVGYFGLRDEYLARFEQQFLSELLARHQGDVRTAALEAKLPRGTLYRLMKKHDLGGNNFR
jgi:two-component system response regulator HydG